MATYNKAYDKLAAGYLFPEIARRTRAFLEKNPGIQVMRLGIGDTTLPLTPAVVRGLRRAAQNLGKSKTYTGYGDSEGKRDLRESIAQTYARRNARVDPAEVFVSDGAKPDAANLQSIFSPDSTVAVQDPAYPVYVDSNVMAGRTGPWLGNRYEGFLYMPCTEANGFFPDVPAGKADLIYLCSPNNPTGAVATHEQLKGFVNYAIARKSAIIFDAAYAGYVKSQRLPRTIYEVEGARRCAIELNSFSKTAGFTGVRLGWTVIPRELEIENGGPGKLHALWTRRQNTMFNGASNIVQAGGLAALSPQGRRESKKMIGFYMQNARIIRKGLLKKGLTVFGGDNAPYLWVKTPGGMGSWEFFDKLLREAHVVSTPGAGFGPGGEGYLRLSAFGKRGDVTAAVESIRKNLAI